MRKSFGSVAALAVAMGLAAPAAAQQSEFDRCCASCDASDKTHTCTGLEGSARQSCELRRHKSSTACMNACAERENTRQQIAAKAKQRADEFDAARKRRAALQSQR